MKKRILLIGFAAMLLLCLFVCAAKENTPDGDYNGDGRCTVLDALWALREAQSDPTTLAMHILEQTAAARNTDLIPIAGLVQQSENGDHASDDYRTASLEINKRENVQLSSALTGKTRYDNAYYPRVKKVRDGLYLLLFMYGRYGQHLYYATSKDGIHWDPPEVLWNSADYKFTYEYGELAGTADRIHAVNPDACVLQNGDVLCVYAVRASKGYQKYPELCGLFMKRGTIDVNGKFVWSTESRIYTGQVWEPGILQRTDGQIHVYFTHVAPYINRYYYDESHRSTGAALIVSDDNGKTWTPFVEPGDTNYYRAKAVFQEYVGDKDGLPHYNGQMPVGVQLANGKILLTTEVKQLDGKYRVSYALSDEGGEWKALDWTEENPGIVKLTSTSNSSPYVDRFLSGEVYLTHNYGGSLRGHLGAADGSAFSGAFVNAPGATGLWGSCTVLDTHRAVTAMHHKWDEETFGIDLFYAYLNHRIDALHGAITVDGYTDDWADHTDALFIGSESQAQFTTRVAHDDENVYFLLSRLDDYLQPEDSMTVCIAAGNTADYRLTVDLAGNTKLEYYENGTCRQTLSGGTVKTVLLGTLGNNGDTDRGAVVEIALPKTLVGLTGKTGFGIRPALVNKDGEGTVSDTLSGASAFSTALWPKVKLK